MILPTFTYCGILSHKLTSTQQKRLSAVCARVSAVHRSRRAGAGAGVLTYFAGAGAGVCSPPVKL